MGDTTSKSPHGPMRRKDREITNRAEIDAILHAGRVMRIALADNNAPFLVPVFYAYDGEAVYFHSAQAGTKVDILKRNPQVCFEVSLDHDVIASDRACDFEARHRTVIGFGRAVFVESDADKADILRRIVGRFSEEQFAFSEVDLRRTAVVRIAIESITGKKHGLA
jgi:uncharacterized protein